MVSTIGAYTLPYTLCALTYRVLATRPGVEIIVAFFHAFS